MLCALQLLRRHSFALQDAEPVIDQLPLPRNRSGDIPLHTKLPKSLAELVNCLATPQETFLCASPSKTKENEASTASQPLKRHSFALTPSDLYPWQLDCLATPEETFLCPEQARRVLPVLEAASQPLKRHSFVPLCF